MRLRPVIDVQHGLAVRAVGGNRADYRPFRSPLSPAADPLTLARQVRERWGTNAVYLADLDAIAHGGPASSRANAALWHALVADGFDLLLDPGVRHAGDIGSGLTPADSRIVVATESAESLAEFRKCLSADVTVGCDLRGDRLLGPQGVWEAVRRSDRPVLALDLAAVGVGEGLPTLPLCRELLAERPSRTVLTGGGVRSIADVRAAESAGVSELLVASALYDGRLSAEALRPYLPAA
ncbi:HisA/HisF-related TIM barrel protein [Alienimonas sp. DA493]|uniref:HisA/HisF-related TIM barrel protein n=1 Tax=Alienimonas sp. DA493 TaxID=3373605 RepID=UPI00375501A1